MDPLGRVRKPLFDKKRLHKEGLRLPESANDYLAPNSTPNKRTTLLGRCLCSTRWEDMACMHLSYTKYCTTKTISGMLAVVAHATTLAHGATLSFFCAQRSLAKASSVARDK